MEFKEIQKPYILPKIVFLTNFFFFIFFLNLHPQNWLCLQCLEHKSPKWVFFEFLETTALLRKFCYVQFRILGTFRTFRNSVLSICVCINLLIQTISKLPQLLFEHHANLLSKLVYHELPMYSTIEVQMASLTLLACEVVINQSIS